MNDLYLFWWTQGTAAEGKEGGWVNTSDAVAVAVETAVELV